MKIYTEDELAEFAHKCRERLYNVDQDQVLEEYEEYKVKINYYASRGPYKGIEAVENLYIYQLKCYSMDIMRSNPESEVEGIIRLFNRIKAYKYLTIQAIFFHFWANIIEKMLVEREERRNKKRALEISEQNYKTYKERTKGTSFCVTMATSTFMAVIIMQGYTIKTKEPASWGLILLFGIIAITCKLTKEISKLYTPIPFPENLKSIAEKTKIIGLCWNNKNHETLNEAISKTFLIFPILWGYGQLVWNFVTWM